jgi:hypothetical protein
MLLLSNQILGGIMKNKKLMAFVFMALLSCPNIQTVSKEELLKQKQETELAIQREKDETRVKLAIIAAIVTIIIAYYGRPSEDPFKQWQDFIK